MKKLLTYTILFFACATCFAQKATIALNLTKGTTYYMVTNTNMTINQTINGQLQNVNSSLKAKTAFTVTAVMDTAYTMQVQDDRIGIQMALPTGTMDFKSDTKENPEYFQLS